MMPRVAGHDLGDTPNGYGCTTCGKTWRDMLDRRPWAAGDEGVAHVGRLNPGEVLELMSHEAERNDHIWRVTMGRGLVDA